MNIGLIRGPFLNKYEMKNYELLSKHHDLLAFGAKHFGCHNTEGIQIPIVFLDSLQGFGYKFHKQVGEALNYYLFHWFGYTVGLFGLEDYLPSMDVVHTVETYHLFTYQALKAKKRYQTKVVITQWENIPFNYEEKPLLRKVKDKSRKQADLFIAVTNCAKHALLFEGVQEERIRVLPMGVDLDRFKPTEKDRVLMNQIGISNDSFVVLFVGRLVPEKGVFDALKAARLVMNSTKGRYDIKFLFVGEGPEASSMVQMIKKLGLSEHVLLLGSQPYRCMPAIHSLADVFILPSIPTNKWTEQFGMVLVESMASGKAVVSTCSGSIPEVVDRCGILVPPRSHNALANAILRLMKDETLRKTLGERARRRAETIFDSIIVAGKLKEIYEQL